MAAEPVAPSLEQIRLETAQDFIDALQQRPQFQEAVLRHLLTSEMLNLPEQVKQLKEDFMEHRNEFLEHRKEFVEHRKEFLELRNEFIELRNEFREHARKTDQRLESIGGTVSRLDGANYENQAADYAPRRMRTILKLSQPSAIATPKDKAALHAIADQAVLDGVISDDEADDLLLADAVFAAVGPDGSPVFVVAEASITAKAHDCDRAVRRAKIMSRATEETPTIPVVISAEAPDELVQERQREVTFFNIPNSD